MKRLLLAVAVLSTIISCQKTQNYNISGVWSDGDGETVYIGITNDKNEVISYEDSVIVENGLFTMTSELKSIGVKKLITQYGDSDFFLSDEAISVEVTTRVKEIRGEEKKFADMKFGNGLEQDNFAYYQSCHQAAMLGTLAVAFALPKAKEEGNQELQDSILNIYVTMQEKKTKGLDSLFYNFPDTYMAAYILLTDFARSKKYEELDVDYAKLTDRVKGSFIGTELRATLDEIQKTALGQVAPDFTSQTPEGEDFTMSSLRGKYVLLDFWASWCGPCIAELPNVKSVYDEFKDKGFEILSISLDDDKEKWTKAIEKYDMDWNHVSSLQGWKCPVAKLYNVTGVPAMILLDKEGKIISNDLRGEKLRENVSEYIK